MKHKRPYLLTWIIIPVVALLAAANYLFGTLNKPVWDNAANLPAQAGLNGNVLGSQTDPVIDLPPIEKINLPQTTSKGVVSIWFDDGWTTQFSEGLPLMEKYGYKGALAVPTHLIGYPAYMDWNQVKSLQHQGWEIGAHTRTHTCDASKYDRSFMFEELLGSKQDLLSLGLRADNYISPCGVHTKEMIDFAKTIFFSLRTSDPGVNTLPLLNPYELKSYVLRNTTTSEDISKWIGQTKEKRAWLILTVHQIEPEAKNEFDITPQFLEEILQKIKESDLPVVLPIQLISLRAK